MITQVPRKNLSFWADDDADPCSRLEGATAADVVIVGGGLTGLSAAYHQIVGNPQSNIVLVESHIIGSGASGRNTGILRPGVGRSLKQVVARYGESEARQLYAASVDAVAHVKRLIECEGLDCDFENAPHIKAALTRRHARGLQAECAVVNRMGFAADYLNEREMSGIAPVRYRGGIRFPQSGLLNPVKLCRELKRVVTQRGVRIFENSPVQAIHTGTPLRVETQSGVITAGHVVVGTNGYTGGLGLLTGHVVPIHTHLSLSRTLSADELSRLTWCDRMSFADKRNLFNYFRLTPDNRIMFGGGRPLYRASKRDPAAGESDIANPPTWRRNEREFAKLFPTLNNLEFERRWSGTIGMTLDELPVIGELSDRPGVFYAGGWCGHGVSSATASGALIADMLMQRTLPANMRFIRAGAKRLPSDPVRGLALSGYLTGLQLADYLTAAADRIASRPQDDR